MDTIDYLEKAISSLNERDNHIKDLFYSITDVDVPIEGLHQEHHNIKKWIVQLSQIRSEMLLTCPAEPTEFSIDKTIFIIKRRDMNDVARGILTPVGFKVLAGSYISPDIVTTMYGIVKEKRRKNKGIIDERNYLVENIDFDNPGQAARFVIGKQVNGLVEWKTEEGILLKEYLKQIGYLDS